MAVPLLSVDGAYSAVESDSTAGFHTGFETVFHPRHRGRDRLTAIVTAVSGCSALTVPV